MTERKTPGEILVVASVIGSLAFLGFALLYSLRDVRNVDFLAVLPLIALTALGAVTLRLLLHRRIAGAVLCAVFYGIQVFSIVLPSGFEIALNSLPTITYRIFRYEESLSVRVNVVSLFLCFLSFLLLEAHRKSGERPGPG